MQNRGFCLSARLHLFEQNLDQTPPFVGRMDGNSFAQVLQTAVFAKLPEAVRDFLTPQLDLSAQTLEQTVATRPEANCLTGPPQATHPIPTAAFDLFRAATAADMHLLLHHLFGLPSVRLFVGLPQNTHCAGSAAAAESNPVFPEEHSREQNFLNFPFANLAVGVLQRAHRPSRAS